MLVKCGHDPDMQNKWRSLRLVRFDDLKGLGFSQPYQRHSGAHHEPEAQPPKNSERLILCHCIDEKSASSLAVFLSDS